MRAPADALARSTLCAGFNGEIYTHQTIRDELADRVTFRSSSDTETLLHGLIYFGEELLPRLNGIFAFAFYDTQTHQLLIARDQFGIKPLYYTLAGTDWRLRPN